MQILDLSNTKESNLWKISQFAAKQDFIQKIGGVLGDLSPRDQFPPEEPRQNLPNQKFPVPSPVYLKNLR